jgi:ComF family protein
MPRTGFWLRKENPVEQMFWGRVQVERACSFFYFSKGSRFRKLLHALKYHNKPQVGVELGLMLGYELRHAPDYSEITSIVPVPLHPRRQRKRGYNQSEKIAQGIAQSFGRPMLADAVIRQVYNDSQTTKTREERHTNVADIFAVTPQGASKLEGQHLLVVDDVLTTGATLESCIDTILKATSCKVSVATLAVTGT